MPYHNENEEGRGEGSPPCTPENMSNTNSNRGSSHNHNNNTASSSGGSGDSTVVVAVLRAQLAESRAEAERLRAAVEALEREALSHEELAAERRAALEFELSEKVRITAVLQDDARRAEERAEARIAAEAQRAREAETELAALRRLYEPLRVEQIERLRRRYLDSHRGDRTDLCRALYEVFAADEVVLQGGEANRRHLLRPLTTLSEVAFAVEGAAECPREAAPVPAAHFSCFMSDMVVLLPCLARVSLYCLPDVRLMVLPWVARLPASVAELDLLRTPFATEDIVEVVRRCPHLERVRLHARQCTDWAGAAATVRLRGQNALSCAVQGRVAWVFC